MVSRWEETINSLNSYVNQLGKEVEIMLAAFDVSYPEKFLFPGLRYDVLRNTKAGLWKNVGANETTPNGGTPLLDAAGKMISTIEDENHEKAIFVILTDGEENQSQVFKKEQIVGAISKMKNKGYEVLFMGANFDKIGDVARSYGLADNKFINIKAGNMNEAFRSFTSSSMNYASGGQAINFSEQDKAIAGKVNS
jgi:hypothetical protein